MQPILHVEQEVIVGKHYHCAFYVYTLLMQAYTSTHQHTPTHTSTRSTPRSDFALSLRASLAFESKTTTAEVSLLLNLPGAKV